MNTQLFFDPFNPNQANYWHRDTQYQTPPAQERDQLGTIRALHYRLALFDEPGIELVPGSHQHWDNNEELDIRLARNGRQPHESLSRGKIIPLQAGDLLIFDAAMLHRGLYGKDRMALDILFCEPLPDLLRYVDPLCLPDESILNTLEHPASFITTLKHLAD